jgi:hypothetical protein
MRLSRYKFGPRFTKQDGTLHPIHIVRPGMIIGQDTESRYRQGDSVITLPMGTPIFSSPEKSLQELHNGVGNIIGTIPLSVKSMRGMPISGFPIISSSS